MFSFFGAFADPVPGTEAAFTQRWPDVDVVGLQRPYRGIGVRFQTSVYEPSDEDMPEAVVQGVCQIAEGSPRLRIMLLRTECFGGLCENWGGVIRDGRVIARENGRGALRRLMLNFDVDIGEGEIFAPLARDFPWGSAR